ELAEAMDTLENLERAGISLRKVTDDLLADGLKKFVEPFTRLVKAVERRCREANKARINGQSYVLPAPLAAEVTSQLKEWDAQGGPRRPGADGGSPLRGTARRQEDALHRLQPVRLHPRAQHLQGLFLRPRQAGPGRRARGKPLRGGDRSRLQPREGGEGRRLPPRAARREEHRRPLLRPFQLRYGPGGGDGPRLRAAARRGRAHAA